jgi:hypothetical protein
LLILAAGKTEDEHQQQHAALKKTHVIPECGVGLLTVPRYEQKGPI